MKKWYEIKNLAGSVEVCIFDEIGGWGVDVSYLIRDLSAYKGQSLTLLINSPGGSVFDGLALYNFLKNNFPNLRAEVVGLAASIASVLFLAGSERVMNAGTFLMIHNPWVGAGGSADDLRKTAEILDKIKAEMVGIYCEKTGLSAEDISAMMDAETWLTSADALEKGFASEVTGGQAVAACIDAKKYGYRNAPAALLAAPTGPVENCEYTNEGPAAPDLIQVVANGPAKEETNMDPEVIENAAPGVDVQNMVVQTPEQKYALKNMSGREFLNLITTASGPLPKEIGELQLALFNTNIVREKAKLIKVRGDYALTWSNGVGGGWGTEGSAISETAVTLTPVTFGAYILQGRFDITDAQMEDNAESVYSILKSEVLSWYGEQEAIAMFGTNVGSAAIQGMFYYDAVNGQKTDTAAIGAFTKADLLGFLDGLETKYGSGTELFMSPSVLAAVTALRDNTGAIEFDRVAKNLNGYRYNIHDACPAYAITTGAPLILAADLSKFYGIAQRGGDTPVRIKEVPAPDAFATRVLYQERLDARIINPKAGKLFRVK